MWILKNSEETVCTCLLMVFTFLDVAATQMLPPIQPVPFMLPNPPPLTGALSANHALKTAEKVHQNLINGSTSFVNHNGSLYVSTVDNEIYDIAACPPRFVASVSPEGCDSMQTCGQLTSIRLDPLTEELFALVNFIGLLRINPETGNTTTVFSAQTTVNKRAPVYLTDFVVMSDGTIIMADASDTYAYPNDVYICLDSRPTGRLLAFNLGTGMSAELLPNKFVNPSSLEMTSDSDLLVSEACRARIRRVSLQSSSLLEISDFAVNLPGIPDNIRATNRGTYWVALRHARHGMLRRNPLDFYSQMPQYRSMATQYMGREQLEDIMGRWGIVLELNQQGRAIGSLHDPEGSSFQRITEVQEFDGILYIASDKTPYLGRIILHETKSRKIKVEGVVQVLRSRCQLPDKDVASTRARLLEKYPQLA